MKEHFTFYLVRHGETEWNQQGRVQGHIDIPLTSKGEEQAHARAESSAILLFTGSSLQISSGPGRQHISSAMDGRSLSKLQAFYVKCLGGVGKERSLILNARKVWRLL